MKSEAQALKDTWTGCWRPWRAARGTATRAARGQRWPVRLPTGTIYPALHRLEAAGLISGSWSVVEGRRRRSCRLTAAGRRRLAGDRATWQEFATTVSSLLHRPRPTPA